MYEYTHAVLLVWFRAEGLGSDYVGISMSERIAEDSDFEICAQAQVECTCDGFHKLRIPL